MKYNLKSVALLAIACFVTLLPCQAQQKSPKTLLWKIEGKNIQTSYLYGTFHILPEEDFLLKDKVKTAFNASEQLVLELDMDDPQLQAEMFKYIAMTSDQTLQDFFTQEELDTLNSWTTQSAGFAIDNMMNWKPFMVSTLFINRFLPGKSASFELTFVEMAIKAQKEIRGLESVQDQLSIFDQISYTEQAKDVKDMLHNEQKYLDLYEEMIDLYNAEDLYALYDIVAEGLDGENEGELLLDKRNQAWIAEIGQLAKSKPTFFGVGAAHLGGEQGVIALLKKAGYRVTPVM